MIGGMLGRRALESPLSARSAQAIMLTRRPCQQRGSALPAPPSLPKAGRVWQRRAKAILLPSCIFSRPFRQNAASKLPFTIELMNPVPFSALFPRPTSYLPPPVRLSAHTHTDRHTHTPPLFRPSLSTGLASLRFLHCVSKPGGGRILDRLHPYPLNFSE